MEVIILDAVHDVRIVEEIADNELVRPMLGVWVLGRENKIWTNGDIAIYEDIEKVACNASREWLGVVWKADKHALWLSRGEASSS